MKPPAMNQADERAALFTGKHLLIWLGAFFAVIIAVNAAFIYFAITSFSGLETEDAYRRGIAYNQRLAAAQQEAAFGWRGSLSIDGGQLQLALRNSAGEPIPDATLSAKAGRPSVDAFDRVVELRHVGEGRYRADGAPLDKGAWIVTVDVRAAGQGDGAAQPVLKLKERLWVRQ